MTYELNDEQRLLRDQVRQLLAEHAGPDVLRRLIEDGQDWSEPLWRAMGELGLLGAGIPEAYGGVGLGAIELCVIAEEIGRAVAPVPYISSACLAAEAIVLAGSEAQKTAWLPRLASGACVGAFAWHEQGRPPSAPVCVVRNGRIDGVKSPVADATIADVCIVAVAGEKLALVDMKAEGVTVEALAGFDQLRRHATVSFKGAPAQILDGEGAEGALQRLLDRAAVYGAFEQIGGAESALYMARDYAMQRYIFGRQLASYQAVKHNLANILVQIELARANALHAAAAIGADLPDLPAAAATARLAATEAYEIAARENLQTHGGIGFTWEANCHFHYRRARLLALSLGGVEIWTDRLIDALSAGNDAAA